MYHIPRVPRIAANSLYINISGIQKICNIIESIIVTTIPNVNATPHFKSNEFEKTCLNIKHITIYM